MTDSLDSQARRLPIYQHEEELCAAIRDHRVVVVEGPTGSGKTTQLPRLLLHRARELGLDVPAPGEPEPMRGPTGCIGITQPRRIAAITVAERIAAEEGVQVGEEIGYAIRFDDRTSRRTRVKVMTDGILLQEARNDPEFSAYDLIVVDEAHERSLNIDFTLGLLHRALAQGRDLKVVVSSATLNPRVFQDFFADVAGEVPLVSVRARTHPVDVRYVAPDSGHPDDVAEKSAEEVARIHRSGEPGHVLAFMTGEDMIRRTERAVDDELPGRDRDRGLVVLPLYGRLTREEQERVFEDFPGRRKVVVATNIAETSITIPDIRHVIDTGMAKIPRVSPKTGITTLREEGISRSSAEQRAGRAGRTAPGEAIRLYGERELAQRPEFADEEILRLDLADTVLRLIDLGIHDVERFPFPTPPPRKRIKAALQRLRAMGAIDEQRRLTHIGLRMVPFPLPPSLSRMIVEAVDRFPDAVDEVLIAGAFLSDRNPFLFPTGEEQAARNAQRRLTQPAGDTMTAVHTYRCWCRASDREAFCEAYYLDPQVMAFIGKTHAQLTEIAESQGIQVRGGAPASDVIRAVASGFADRILRRRGRNYEGPGDTKISIHPSSVLFGSGHRYVVASHIMISQRAYAHHLSPLEPSWIAEINPSLARNWRLQGPSGGPDRRREEAAIPSTLQLDGVELPVKSRGRKAFVDIPLEVVDRLRDVEPSALSARAAKWKARIVSNRHRFAQGTPMGEMLALLKHMRLPEPEEWLDRHTSEGLLMEGDRDLHLLERQLDQLLRPHLPPRGKRPGWLMLVANGGGGYWLELTPDFYEALTTTLHAAEDLLATLADEDPLRGRLDPLVEGLDEEVDQLERALAQVPAKAQHGR